ncbi:MAG TPA: glycosyltransferase [Candidatus Dormibacteraeota bacterium]|jgi:processive 1,2-diacylglycerol beta-glucosyltransferase|nr:glycosyltransferase [Candidatus Dormibacteraeota bacterium]
MPTRVLILSASYGSGHAEAARSLATAFEARGVEPAVVDHFRELVHPVFASVSRAIYYRLLRHAPGLWAIGYGMGDRLGPDSPLAFGMPQLGRARLARLLDTLRPDAVVTVHATPAAALAALTLAGHPVPPHTTAVTDYVAHSQWMARPVDRYCVAAEEVRNEFVARGIPPERVVVTGVPVRAEFSRLIDPIAARRTLGLSPHRRTVVAMAGTQGSLGRLVDVTRALLTVERPLQAVIVAGHDERLRSRLAGLVARSPLRVVGYTDDVSTLLAAADLLVTKAGGMTLAEATAAEVPLLLYGSLPGQERGNERFASRAGIALVARSRGELRRRLDRALGDPDTIERMQGSLRRLGRPDAAQHIVELVLEQIAARRRS